MLRNEKVKDDDDDDSNNNKKKKKKFPLVYLTTVYNLDKKMTDSYKLCSKIIKIVMNRKVQSKLQKRKNKINTK